LNGSCVNENGHSSFKKRSVLAHEALPWKTAFNFPANQLGFAFIINKIGIYFGKFYDF